MMAEINSVFTEVGIDVENVMDFTFKQLLNFNSVTTVSACHATLHKGW